MTTLDHDEQSELPLKVRYGIGLERLVGGAASAIRPTLPAPSAHPAPPVEPEPTRSDAEIRARAAALGVRVGSRWRWLSR